MAGLGTETHLFFRGETVLRRGFDPYIVETLMNEMTAHGPELHKYVHHFFFFLLFLFLSFFTFVLQKNMFNNKNNGSLVCMCAHPDYALNALFYILDPRGPYRDKG